MSRMKIIGITGGVGCGKSRVLAWFRENCHAAVYEADRIAKELQTPGHACYEAVAEAFGPGILDADGQIDRVRLSERVFGHPKELGRLNALVHPAVKEEVLRLREAEEKQGTSLFVLEAALLLEDGYDRICDEIWYIYASVSVREERLKASRGYSGERIRRMMASQRTEESFRLHCKRTIDNSGSFEETCSQLQNAVESLYCEEDDTGE